MDSQEHRQYMQTIIQQNTEIIRLLTYIAEEDKEPEEEETEEETEEDTFKDIEPGEMPENGRLKAEPRNRIQPKQTE